MLGAFVYVGGFFLFPFFQRGSLRAVGVEHNVQGGDPKGRSGGISSIAGPRSRPGEMELKKKETKRMDERKFLHSK